MLNHRILPIIASVLFIISTLPAQDDLPVWKKLRYLSEEEMYQPITTGRDFIETDPPGGNIRNVAEFDPMQGVLVRYPFGIPVEVMRELSEDVEVITIVNNETEENQVISIYENNGVRLENCRFLYAPTNSWWVRDYGPWFVFDGTNQPGIVDFPYNRPRPKDNDIPSAVAQYLDIDLYGMNLSHTGGNYMTDGLGNASSTDLILEENPSLSEEDVNNKLREYLAIDQYFVLADPLDDYIKHIDCWGKFLTPGKVLIGQVDETDYRYQDYEAVVDFFANTTSAYGVPYEVYRVYTPGQNQVTPYTNSLIVNDKVFVPISGSQWDDEALASYEAAMPGYEIIGIYFNGWYNTDALHCRAKGVADLGMLYIEHKPELGMLAYRSQIPFLATITAYSGAGINPDSVFLHYSQNGLAFDKIRLEPGSGSEWHCELSGLQPGDQVQYYISAIDSTGRKAMHPFIGRTDPHAFVLEGKLAALELSPDTLIFNNYDKFTNGLTGGLYNQVGWDINLTDIRIPQNPVFSIDVELAGDFPIVLQPQQHLDFQVTFNEPIPEMGTLLTDSLVFITEQNEYPVYIRIDRTGTPVKDIDTGFGIRLFPNPSSGPITLVFETHQPGLVSWKVFDATGRQVWERSEAAPSGVHRWFWSGTDEQGNRSTAGIYHFELKTGQGYRSGSFILE